VVSERVAEVESATGEDLRAFLLERAAYLARVVDHDADVAGAVGRLGPPLGDRQELVTHVDERHPRDAPAELELEHPAVELERPVEVVDLDRDVVHPDQARA
jgi:hypothetical protein